MTMTMIPTSPLPLTSPHYLFYISSYRRSLAKDIRRAYYRKSLQWHPDRWSGLGMYTVAVKGK